MFKWTCGLFGNDCIVATIFYSCLIVKLFEESSLIIVQIKIKTFHYGRSNEKIRLLKFVILWGNEGPPNLGISMTNLISIEGKTKSNEAA